MEKKDSRRPGVLRMSSTDACPAGLITENSKLGCIPGVYKGVVRSISSKVHDFLAGDAVAGNCSSDVVFCSSTSTLDTIFLLWIHRYPSHSYSLPLEAPKCTG